MQMKITEKETVHAAARSEDAAEWYHAWMADQFKVTARSVIYVE
jgi:hypothetical protein